MYMSFSFRSMAIIVLCAFALGAYADRKLFPSTPYAPEVGRDGGQPRVDGSSPSAFDASLDRVRGCVPAGERANFERAMKVLMADASPDRVGSDGMAAFRSLADGKSWQELVGSAREVQSRRMRAGGSVAREDEVMEISGGTAAR